MVRTFPPERFAQLIAVATKIFVVHGYRLTQMSEIAEGLGVAKGTLYGYIESKEALFDAAVRFADRQAPEPPTSSFPLATPSTSSTIEYIRARLADEVREMELVAALAKPAPERSGRVELELIVRDLFRRMARNRRALKLIDRCAADHPELAAVWFAEGRYGQVALLADYLEQRVQQGRLRAMPDVNLAARMILETIALWAIHMPWDPAPQPFDDEQVEASVADLIVNAYAKERRR